jgi:hypothetical protein
MGLEATCTARHDRKSAAGKALLETKELIFRSPDLRFAIPYAKIERIHERDGVLHVTWDGKKAEIDLGEYAPRWLQKILNPKSILDKLGVKPGMRISLVNVKVDLEGRTDDVHSRAVAGSDIIFFGADSAPELAKLATLAKSLKPNGAIWVIRPKGRKEITDSDVMAAGKKAGLVDVKVAGYSDTHTAEKLVIPVARRR